MITTDDRLQWLLDIVEQSLADPEMVGRGAGPPGTPVSPSTSTGWWRRAGRGARRAAPGAAAWSGPHTGSRTERQVIEIALDAGDGSPEAFTRAFARAYGASPRAYRRRPERSTTGRARRRALPSTGRAAPAVDSKERNHRRPHRMVDHHLWLVGEIVDRTGRVDDARSPPDRALGGVIDGLPTWLRRLSDKLVYQLEMWGDGRRGRHRDAAARRHHQRRHAPPLDHAAPGLRERRRRR